MRRVDAAASHLATEGTLTPVTVGSHEMLLTRIEGRVHAVSRRCPHLGFSMGKARVSGGVIECPWHGSRFDCRTGANVDWVRAFAGIPMPRWSHKLIALGREPAALPTFAVEEEQGRIFVILDDPKP